MSRGPRITVEQQDEIIRLRLEGATKEGTARAVGVNHATVTKYWREYLASVAEDRKGSLERLRLERELVHRQRAQRARRRQELEITEVDVKGETHVVAMDPRGLAALMTEEARAEAQIDRLLGIDKLVIEATVDVSQHAPELQRIVMRGLELAETDDDIKRRVLAGIAAAAREYEERA